MTSLRPLLVVSLVLRASSSAVSACPPATCYTPSSSAFNATDFSDWLTANNGSALAVAAGEYTLAAPAAGARAHLVLPPLASTAVDFSGVTLVAADRRGAGV
jgi:hypothetical protein